MAALKFTFNKSLGPVTILVAGPTALGVAIVLGFMIWLPELRTPSDILFGFGVGMVAGLVIFAPIAAALSYRAKLVRWLAPR
ncbi:MAG TPA: hypothetical protein VN887_16530, partial [Candidatus Angelobacter sp.]|nr:hypothetical protein [Candidatus Angelobacter sp.]